MLQQAEIEHKITSSEESDNKQIWGVTPVWRSDVRVGEKEGPQDKKPLPTNRPPLDLIVWLSPLKMGEHAVVRATLGD